MPDVPGTLKEHPESVATGSDCVSSPVSVPEREIKCVKTKITKTFSSYVTSIKTYYFMTCPINIDL